MPIVDVYLLFASRRRPAVRQPVPGGAAQERRNRAGVDGGQLRRSAASRTMQALLTAPRVFGPTLPQPCEAASSRDSVDRLLAARRPSTPRPTRASGVSSNWSPFRRSSRRSSGASSRISPTPTRCTTSICSTRAGAGRPMPPRRCGASPSGCRTCGRRRCGPRPRRRWPRRSSASLAFRPRARSSIRRGTATVRWNDMRFTGGRVALAPTQNDPFAVVVRIAPDGHVLEQHLGPVGQRSRRQVDGVAVLEQGREAHRQRGTAVWFCGDAFAAVQTLSTRAPGC